MAEKRSAKTTAKKSAGKATEKVAEQSGAKTKTSKSPAEVSSKKAAKKSGSKKGLVWGLIGVGLAAVAGIVVALVLNLNQNGTVGDPTAMLSYSRSFFISDDNKYTLWNADGQRLTKDEYSEITNFVGGYARVKKDNQYGVLREDGKPTVEFGKYGMITNQGGLYLAQDGNTKTYYLITGAGGILAQGSDLKVYAPSNQSAGFAAAEMDGKLRVYNYAGKLMTEIQVADDAEEPTFSSAKDFGVMYYAGQSTVFDARSGAMMATLAGAEYSFDSVSDDRTIIILENESEDGKYKMLRGGRIYDLDEAKYYSIADRDIIIGYNSYSELALLNNDYKVATWVDSYLQLKDIYNYATENKDGRAEIYRNGEKIKEFGEDSNVAASGVLYEDYYAIEEGGKAMFYNLDGSVGINHEFKEIKSIFREHHHAVVSDAEGEYYLIDAKGNRVGDATAASISIRDGGYELKNSDGKYAIANTAGKLVTEFKYTSTYYRDDAEPRNIWTGRISDKSFDVVDVASGKFILTDVNVDGFYANYFKVKNADGKTEYYTYDGKLFYTSVK